MQSARHYLMGLAGALAVICAVPVFLLVFAATFPVALATASLRYFLLGR